MFIGSYKKPKLKEIAIALNIEYEDYYDKVKLSEIIINYLTKNKRVLK